MSQTLRVHVELPVDGMTCAGCASRIERRLNGIEGVEASVNLALERAAVDYDPGRVSPRRSRRRRRGRRLRRARAGRDPAAAADDRLGLRVIVTAVLAVPVIAYSMASGLQSTGRDWVALALTLPAVLWGGWPIHRATLAQPAARRGTMDTLISLGVAAALGWSLVALVAPGVAEHLYLEVAAGRDAVHPARPLSRGAREAPGRARPARAADARRRTWPCSRDGVERRVPRRAAAAGDRVRRPARRADRDRRRRPRGLLGASTARC